MSDHDLASQIKEDVRKSRRASFLWTLAGVAAGLASILWVVTQSYGISRSAEVLARGDALRALAPIAQTLGVTAPPEDYAKYVSDMQEAGRKLAAASQEVPALRLQNTALEAEQQETADELNAAQGELTRVSAEIPILKQREVALQTEKKVAEASAEKLAEEKRSIAEELATKDVIAEQFRKQSEEGETQIAALALKVAGAEADLIATTSKLRTSETSRAALESEIAKSSGRISELSGSLKAKDTEIAMLSLRIKTLKGSGRDGQQSETDKLTRELDEARSSNSGLATALKTKDSEVARLNARIATLEESGSDSQRSEINRLANERDAANARNGELENSRDDLQRRLDVCNEEKARAIDFPNCSGVMQTLEEQIFAAQAQRDSCETKLGELIKESGNCQANNEQLNVLSDQLSICQREENRWKEAHDKCEQARAEGLQ